MTKPDLLRSLALLLLSIITIYGIWQGFNSDWQPALAIWQQKAPVLLLAWLVSILDVLLDIVLWLLICTQWGIQVRDKTGVFIFFSMYAGTLLPAQLGRLLRPDALQQLGRGSFQAALAVEIVSFYLAGTAAVAFLAGLVGYKVHPLLGPVAALATSGILLALAHQVSRFLSDTPLDIRPAYWLQPGTLLLVGLAGIGWLLHGLTLYILVYDLPAAATLWGALFAGPGSTVLGMGTGLPGGIGAIEGFLGLSLQEAMNLSGLHLALTVGAFRLITFWVWLPLGWVCLAVVNHQIAQQQQKTVKNS